ncbi:ESCRT-0 subunit protein hse1 [Chytridiales sp. JEL 0842]|nr:ESCRT-0 subunit protein hse1 [Chytridiales sp. JEL 0842]
MGVEDIINQATAETNTSDNWSLIIELCEQAGRTETTAREAIQALSRRVVHRNVNVVLFTLTVANALVQNCGKIVHQEISSRLFVDALVKQVANNTVHEIVRVRILELIQTWAETFKADPALGFMVDTYNQLKAQNYPFPDPNKKPQVVKTQSSIAKEKEEEELQLAMALSLSAQETKKKAATARKQEPANLKSKVVCRVRALYDFAGLEEGELRLQRGDVVDVYDDTTFKDWWKGEVRGKIGIFPSNYVEKLPDGAGDGSASGFAAPSGLTSLSDSAKVDEFVQLLSRIDPRRESLSENEHIQDLYHALLLLRPKVVKDVERNKAAQDELVMLNERFTVACSTYHKLMEASLAAQRNAYQNPPTQYGSPYGGQYQQPYHPQQPVQTPAQPVYGYQPAQPGSYYSQ